MGKQTPVEFSPTGLSDTQDSTNSFRGAMQLLTNLVPAPSTENLWTPRPAQTLLASGVVPGVTTPLAETVLFENGTRTYGMISDGSTSKDYPFCYDSAVPGYVTITIDQATFPTTQPTSGDWTPPTMTLMPNGRIIITHIGYPGTSGHFFGVIDTGSFSLAFTGSTNSNATLNALSINPLTSGIEVGMPLSSAMADIPAGALVKSFDATSITMSTNATGSNAGQAITVTGGTSAAPTYASINTNGTALASVPVGCALSPAGRAAYLTGNNVVLSDSLHSSQVTNASQVLTIGDQQPCTAIAPQAFTSQTQGGAIAALIVFKGDGVPYQITGDIATTNLLINSLNAPAGTLAVNTLAPTPMGLMWVSQDGLRYIDPLGVVRGPIGLRGSGINQPFLNVVNPSRMCGAYNANTYRVSLTYKQLDGTAAWQTKTGEFWYHFSNQESGTQAKWSGPHTCFNSLIAASQQDTNHGFVSCLSGVNAKLFFSTVTPQQTSVYTENGVALAWDYRTSLLPERKQVSMSAMIEMNVMIALAGAGDYLFSAVNEQGGTISGSSVTFTPAQWNVADWNEAYWASAFPAQVPVWWTQPWVFQQMAIDITGPSAAGVLVGNLYAIIEKLGYASATFRPALVAP